jgi:hypothetical protein
MTKKKPWFITGVGRGGADSIALAEQKVAALHEQIDAFRHLSTSLAYEDANAGVA